MAVSTLQNITPKFKDFTNVTTDSNGFVSTGLYFVPVLGFTNLGGVLSGSSQPQISINANGEVGVRFMTWNGATPKTGTISFRIHYI